MRSRQDLRSAGRLRPVVCLVLFVFAAACASPQLDRRPLYAQLGGEAGLAALVDRFLQELARDPDAAPQFRGVDVKRFRTQLTLHLCQTFDGPCRYEGASLAEVHRGMQISQREFNAVVEDLVRAMESLRLPTPVQNRVLARLAPLREQVVGQAHPPHSSPAPGSGSATDGPPVRPQPGDSGS
jgi:hemoglobin